MRAASFVLLSGRRAVLVGTDGDVLGSVVGGQVALAQCEQRGSQRQRTGC